MSHLDVKKQSDPFDLFVFAINAEQTREKYITRLKKFFKNWKIQQNNMLTINFFNER